MIESAVSEAEKSERVRLWKSIVAERGRRYERCQLNEFKTGEDEHRKARRDALTKVSDFCVRIESGDAKANLIFAGPSGSGKDHLMFYVLRFAVMHCGVRASWVDGQRLFSELRDGITQGRTEREILLEHIKADVLAMSDPVPPSGQLSDHQRNTLYRLIDERYSQCRPIWMTVNAANAKELDERMGVQLVDRLLHDAVAVNCYWPSYRRSRR